VLGVVCGCLLSSASISQAQVRGRVLDSTDRPVAEALVELWGPGGRIAATNSDANGAFVFLTTARPPLAVFARKIGYSPTRIAVVEGQLVEVRLRRREQMLAALTVTANSIRCVTRNDGAGRRLWEAARRQYGPPPMVVVAFPGGRQLTMGLRGDGRTHTAFVPSESLGVLDTSALRENSTWRLGMPNVILSEGPSRFYAQDNPGGEGGRFDHYRYPLLDSYQAFHFTDSLFGEWNRIGAPVRDHGSLVVEFCSRHERGQSFIAGTLTFTPESTLASGRWSFVTPDELAGGSVWFAPRSTGEQLPPLAAIGLFWRRREHDVYQQWTLYDQWYACPPADGPCRDRRAIGEVR